MPDASYLLAAVLVSAAVTWGLRAAPFAVLAPLRESRLISYLGAYTPVGVMIALVGYTLRDVRWVDVTDAGPVLIAATVTIALQLWRSNLVISLAAGTLVHVALATAVLR